MTVLDKNVLIHYYFEEISKIPRGSYNEEGIADYIESLAVEKKWKY